jgi:hypothetical protein
MWIAARAGRFYQAQQSINNRARRLFTYDATRPVHFTAPINAFSVSSGGQQQRSTPLFGSGASMSISTGQPVIGALLSRSVLTQRLVIPAATRAVPVDRLRGPFRARLLLGQTFWRRLNVRRYERKRDQ